MYNKEVSNPTIKKVFGTILNESILIKLFAGIFLLRRLESCAETGKAIMISNKQTIYFSLHANKQYLNKVLCSKIIV